jgi:hypothetical protein
MGIIYVLQKQVPGLGRLTKVGMTTRSAEDRAAEYGGGGWDVVDELPLSIDEPNELHEIEGRIHDRLHQYRCGPAVGFGLTEVFTCSAEQALAAARAEIGNKADDTDRVERLRRRTNKMVEHKIMQSHAAAIARLHMGKYDKVKDSWRITREYGLPTNTSDEKIAEFLIHTRAMEALDKIGAEAPTFRAMLQGDLDSMRHQWDEVEQDRLHALYIAKLESSERAKKAELQREHERQLQQQREELRAELSAHMDATRRCQDRIKVYGVLIGSCAIMSGLFLWWLIDQWVNSLSLEFYVHLIWITPLLIAAAVVGYLRLRRERAELVEMRRGWDRSHSTL